MLILSRKVDQGIVFSGNILIRVLSVERDRVKLGISAPGDVTVMRQELYREGDENPRPPRSINTSSHSPTGPD